MLHVEGDAVRYLSGGTNGWKEVEVEENNPFVDQAKGVVDWIEGRVEDYRGEAHKARAVVEILMAIFESGPHARGGPHAARDARLPAGPYGRIGPPARQAAGELRHPGRSWSVAKR